MFVRQLFTSALLSSLAWAHSSGLNKRALPYGQLIHSCTDSGHVAITFDDGPFMYTDHVLDLFQASGHKATFFLNGANWGSIYDYSSAVHRMINEGHQVGSHT